MTSVPAIDPFADILKAVEKTIRNLGFSAKLSEHPPEHWQRTLAVVEARMQMHGAKHAGRNGVCSAPVRDLPIV